MARSPIVAVIMMCIPFVNLYLVYKWWTELKALTKKDYNPIVQVIMQIIPIVNIYAIWKLFTTIEEEAKARKQAGFPLGATGLLVVGFITCFIFVGFFILLYMVYKAQDMMNAMGA